MTTKSNANSRTIDFAINYGKYFKKNRKENKFAPIKNQKFQPNQEPRSRRLKSR